MIECYTKNKPSPYLFDTMDDFYIWISQIDIVLHREDGPAVFAPNISWFYIDDMVYTIDEYCSILNLDIVAFKLIWG